MPSQATKSKKGVEIFSAGVWNGDEYTVNDLDDMVAAFKENEVGFRPHLKLGHDEGQEILKSSGLPAAGWITNIYRKGEKLLADFSHIPDKIFQLIENGAYRKVSSEIYWNMKVGQKLYRRMLGAVALLGAENPGVMNLDDILALYGLKGYDTIKSYSKADDESEAKIYSFETEGEQMPQPGEKTAREIELENQLAAEKTKREEAEGKTALFTKQSAEIEQLKKDKIEADKRAADAEAQARASKTETFISSLVSEKLISPAMKPYALALLGEEKKEYSFKAGKDGKEEKKYSTREELLKELLKLNGAAAKVNFEENSGATKVKADVEQNGEAEEIEKYMKENKCNYSTAYRAVTNAKLAEADEADEDDETDEE